MFPFKWKPQPYVLLLLFNICYVVQGKRWCSLLVQGRKIPSPQSLKLIDFVHLPHRTRRELEDVNLQLDNMHLDMDLEWSVLQGMLNKWQYTNILSKFFPSWVNPTAVVMYINSILFWAVVWQPKAQIPFYNFSQRILWFALSWLRINFKLDFRLQINGILHVQSIFW